MTLLHLPRLTRTAAAVAVLAAASSVLAPAASALPEDTWTVDPGGALTAASPLSIQNVTRGWSIDCGQATFTGTAEFGAGNQVDPLVEFDDESFENCAGPDGVGYTVTMTSGVQLEMYASSYDAGAGKTTGTLFGFQLNLVGTNRCQADVADPAGNLGAADATFTNEGSALGLGGGNMGVTFVNFACPSDFIANGDQVVIAARLAVSPAQTITGS
ncbi:hypothetical protein E1293_27010 [Actinomadura darangshiensis]|uniref:Secreted protein n=1 Tax=Actinomadura darangshiensis TaxID=705336 RepID=A0A4R5AWN5_9ACTN|nr:hypothetical protein [Actinomadura darangshiensis]TDD76560.1 hypothetical protein E1293_27010 [Actinomadura darangshiensis]